MLRPRHRILAVLLLLAPLTVPLARAQSQAAGGAIEGTVTDESGAVLPGASVTVSNHGHRGLSRETPTDAGGLFRAPLLPVGSYEVTASLQGFATIKRTGLVAQHRPDADAQPAPQGRRRAAGGDHGHRRGAADRDDTHAARPRPWARARWRTCP